MSYVVGSLVLALIRAAGLVAVTLVRFVLLLPYGLYLVLALARDAWGTRRRYRQGQLRCPEGHVVTTTPGPWTCSSCQFTWSGSIWFCQNPQCGAPTTPFATCDRCGLSVGNPFIWGRS